MYWVSLVNAMQAAVSLFSTWTYGFSRNVLHDLVFTDSTETARNNDINNNKSTECTKTENFIQRACVQGNDTTKTAN